MRRALLLGFASLLLAGTADAATITLTSAKPAAIYKPAGHAVDVLGITPGMGVDAVRAILEKQYGDVQVVQDAMGLANMGVSVTTQTFVQRMAAQKGADQIVVWFGTPTTGNGVVEVTRQLSYLDERAAPDLKQMRADLLARYGAPGYDGTAAGTEEILLLAWSFKGNTPSPCAASSCRADLSEGLDVRSLANYARAVKTGHELTIVATLLAGITDPNKAASIVVTMSDAATKVNTLETAISQMKTATTSKPPAKPGEKPAAKPPEKKGG